MTIILLITFGIHCCPNRVFAEVQYVTSVLKVVVLLLFIFTSCAMIAGAGPTGSVHNGQYWRDLPPFLHNVKVSNVSLLVRSMLTCPGNKSLRHLRHMGSG